MEDFNRSVALGCVMLDLTNIATVVATNPIDNTFSHVLKLTDKELSDLCLALDTVKDLMLHKLP